MSEISSVQNISEKFLNLIQSSRAVQAFSDSSVTSVLINVRLKRACTRNGLKGVFCLNDKSEELLMLCVIHKSSTVTNIYTLNSTGVDLPLMCLVVVPFANASV